MADEVTAEKMMLQRDIDVLWYVHVNVFLNFQLAPGKTTPPGLSSGHLSATVKRLVEGESIKQHWGDIDLVVDGVVNKMPMTLMKGRPGLVQACPYLQS